MIPAERFHLQPSIVRLTPVLVLTVALLHCIVNPTIGSFYLLVALAATFPLNWVIKHGIVQPIYGMFDKEHIPILGIGRRPANANSCTFTLDGKKSNSFGMPSGHSQIIWTAGTYVICKVIDRIYQKHKAGETITNFDYAWGSISCFIVLYVMSYVSYSRVYVDKCHTFQQVVVGGILGIGLGFIIYYFENDFVAAVSK
jgi:hypothetical protein